MTRAMSMYEGRRVRIGGVSALSGARSGKVRHCDCFGRRRPCARVLIAAGAPVMAKANDGRSALEAAEMIGDDEMAALLRATGARH